MKYYRLKKNVTGYSDNFPGIIYPETYINKYGHTVKEFVKSFPNDWEDVDSPINLNSFKFGR